MVAAVKSWDNTYYDRVCHHQVLQGSDKGREQRLAHGATGSKKTHAWLQQDTGNNVVYFPLYNSKKKKITFPKITIGLIWERLRLFTIQCNYDMI